MFPTKESFKFSMKQKTEQVKLKCITHSWSQTQSENCDEQTGHGVGSSAHSNVALSSMRLQLTPAGRDAAERRSPPGCKYKHLSSVQQ